MIYYLNKSGHNKYFYRAKNFFTTNAALFIFFINIFCLHAFKLFTTSSTRSLVLPVRTKKQLILCSEDSGSRASGYISTDGYSSTLITGRKKRKLADRERIFKLRHRKQIVEKQQHDGDGYANLFMRPSLIDKISPFSKRDPGTLILVRSGESDWTQNATFTGWADPDLSSVGKREVAHAARLLVENGYEIDLVFTSRLKRAIRSTWIMLMEMGEAYLPIFKSWRLNARSYGSLTGLCKKEMATAVGHDVVQSWRRDLHARPPPLDSSHPYWPNSDPKHFDLAEDELPLTESLQDCMDRVRPIWEDKISYELRMGRTVLVVAHSNAILGLVKQIDGVSSNDIYDLAIPSGIPFVYKFDKNMKPIMQKSDIKTTHQAHLSALFLEKPGALKEALKVEDEWRKAVPGYDSSIEKPPSTTLERSLAILKAERNLEDWAAKRSQKSFENGGNKIFFQDYTPHVNNVSRQNIMSNLTNDDAEYKLDSSGPFLNDLAKKQEIGNVPCIKAMPSVKTNENKDKDHSKTQRQVIVFLRHGKTSHNKLGLFTGWEDSPLDSEGEYQAKEAGRLLKKHGFKFDVVYTSWLTRAIETAMLCLDEMDLLWLPVITSWRLNERMYGALTGVSKRFVAQKFGADQLKKWRKGYKVRPPPVSSFSPHYPGNDKRYKRFLNDLRLSISESVIRSIESKKIVVSQKFPKTESLYDCMRRTIPYYTDQIVPEAVDCGKRVLIASSENAIRGLLMHLMDIPEEKIVKLEIPNGLPLIYDVKSKCIKLLDDGSTEDPLTKYNFGESAEYLFRPCLIDYDDDDECMITDSMLRLRDEQDDLSEKVLEVV